MIKGKTRKTTWRAIYRLLNMVSPMPFDCGGVCGAACCQAEDGLGMYLLPGEEKIHHKKDGWLSWEKHSTREYDFPPSWHGEALFVNCRGPENCRRELRPMQCRTFPLKPVIIEKSEEAASYSIVYLKEGSPLALIYNNDPLPYCCPLIESRSALDPSYIRATYIVWKHLIRDPLIYDLIKSNSSHRVRTDAE